MPSMTEIKCKCGCGRKKQVRVADKKRGWGLFYSKSCKAKHQERRTGQYSALIHRKKKYSEENKAHAHTFSNEDYFDRKG